MSSSGKRYLIFCILAILVALAFTNSLQNGFVYDDASVISDNPRVRRWHNFQFLFSKRYFQIVSRGKETAFGEASYRPVVTATYFVDSSLWNGKSSGCHLTNTILHFANVILCFIFLLKLVKRPESALLGSIVFAVHPVLSEAVNAISFREDLMVALFFLAGILCFLKIQEEKNNIKKIGLELLHTILYALALFSKEMAVTYPMVLLCILYAKKIDLRSQARIMMCLAVTTVLYIVVRFFIMVNPEETPLFYPGGTFMTNMYTMTTIFAGYIKLILFPLGLLADYQPAPKRYFFEGDVLLSLCVVVLCLGMSVVSFWRKKSMSACGILWFFITLLPVSNIVKIGNIAAERYLYLPLLGVVISFAMMSDAISLRYKKPYLFLMITLITLFSMRTIVRNVDWFDSPSLWRATIKEEPESYRAYSNLATYYFERADYREAIKYYIRCLGFRNSTQDHYNLANCYRMIGDRHRAIDEFHKAIEIDPTYSEVYNNLGLTLMELGRYDEAETVLNKALFYGKNDRSVYENLGVLYDARGKYDNALEYYRKAGLFNHENTDSYNKMAVVYINKGDVERGIKLLLEGVEKFPRDPSLYKNLGVVYTMRNDIQKGIYYWEKAYQLEPRNPETVRALIKLYSTQGESSRVSYYQERLKEVISANEK